MVGVNVSKTGVNDVREYVREYGSTVEKIVPQRTPVSLETSNQRKIKHTIPLKPARVEGLTSVLKFPFGVPLIPRIMCCEERDLIATSQVSREGFQLPP